MMMMDAWAQHASHGSGTTFGAVAGTRRFQVYLLLTGLLVAWLYSAVLKELVFDWWNDPDYAYGFLVPVVAGLAVWQGRARYGSLVWTPGGLGLLVAALGIGTLIVGTLGADYFSSRISLCVVLAGMVAYLCGWAMLRALAFPLAYLALMVPLPGIIHNQLTFPLQVLASRIAEGLLELSGITVFREGNLLHVPHYTAEVAQACSGIRSLLSLIALGAAYAYFGDRRPWVRVTLVCLMLPIAILTNAVRIVTACLLGYGVGAEWAEGFVHLFSGWLIFLVATGLLFLAHSMLGRMASFRRRRAGRHA